MVVTIVRRRIDTMTKPTDTDANRQGGLDPPRFSLRRLFLIVGAIAAFIALFQQFNPLVVTGVIFVGLLIAGHVVGNAIGTRLRSSARPEIIVPKQNKIAPSDFIAPATKLSHRSSLGWPQLAATCFGIVVGGVVGLRAMEYFYGERMETGAILIGVTAASVLGGFWFFWWWSLAQVLLAAWWHAHSSATQDQNHNRRGVKR